AAMKAERQPVTRRSLQRRSAGSSPLTATDEIAVEEPLEIRVAGDTLATIMRTPGEDHFLTAGFLYSEGVIAELADLGKIAHCGRPSEAGYGNLVDVAPGPGTALAPERVSERRGTLVASSCGLCGRERIDDLLARLGPVASADVYSPSALSASIERLSSVQSAFARTGAVHGALALDATGTLLASGEDVGRHNAVDKVVGKLLYAGALDRARADAQLLAVSGRTSFEIVQKAAAARIAVVVSVSGPTSLAIDTATAFGITLVCFARGEGFNVYAHGERITE
ncbi:MAG TPA: formate dehydrogenase accessory sulfurtransferase FdhD, partial [Polyangiales bacterium]|nr:formate dehydrogenase accessory sulfurtransferase FdhD [Polyangiales bacterium]